MLNAHVNDYSSVTHLTQVASYFDIVDSAVKTADTNKRYSITTAVSTAPSPPIAEGAWTHIHIAPTADNMCDFENSYMVAEIKLKLKLSAALKCNSLGGNWPAIYVGYKDAMDCIEQYQIISNGQAIYNQPFAIEESYITNLASTDTARVRETYSKSILSQIQNRPEIILNGGLIILNQASYEAGATVETTLKIKIDYRRFLPLSSIKYMPAFVGNLELRVKFSAAGLVCAALPLNDLITNPFISVNLCASAVETSIAWTTQFVPLGLPIDILTGIEKKDNYMCKATSATDKTTASVYNIPQYAIIQKSVGFLKTEFTVTKCESLLACFGIDDGIYQSLIQRYTGQSLTFPTQTLSFQAMNGTMGNGNPKVSLALTATPRFVDTIFMLFPYNTYHRTCYENPLFDNMRITMGGYGSLPDIPISSYGPEAYEMLQNALNLNNNLIGINEDVQKSLLLHPDDAKKSTGWKTYDKTNYVLAWPTSVDNTFQQGQTSSAPITYEFKAEMNAGSDYLNCKTCTPLMGFLRDSVLAIQLRPSGPPIIAVDEFDISSPQSSAA